MNFDLISTTLTSAKERREETIKDLLAKLPEMAEEGVLTLAKDANHLGWCGILLSGACVSELLKRRDLRLKPGKAKNEPGKKGLQTYLQEFAEKLDAGVSTLRTNARIYDVFFSGEDSLPLARESCLPREFFVTALSAKDPRAAIKMALVKRARGNYTRQQFRAELDVRPKPKSITKATTLACELRVKICKEANSELERQSAVNKKSKDALIEGLLLELAAKHRKNVEKKDSARALFEIIPEGQDCTIAS
jgi:hypothetical protein